jgi:hypothetical protein
MDSAKDYQTGSIGDIKSAFTQDHSLLFAALRNKEGLQSCVLTPANADAWRATSPLMTPVAAKRRAIT